MNNKHIKGLPVISIADGRKLGKVHHVFFDLTEKRIAGFSVVEDSGGLFSMEPEHADLVDVEDVHSLGPAALTLDDAASARGTKLAARYGDFVELEDLLKRKVVTAGGVEVGTVASVDFDERGFQLNAIEVSPGFFKGNRAVLTEHVLSLGPDAVVVVEGVLGDEAEAEAAAETQMISASEAAEVLAPPPGASIRGGQASEFVVGDVEIGDDRPHGTAGSERTSERGG